MLAMDIIKQEPKTEFELHERWKNRLQSELMQLNRYRKTIKIWSADELIDLQNSEDDEIRQASEDDEEAE